MRNAEEEQTQRAARAESEAVARGAELARPPSPAGIRMRRTRERRREGKISIRRDISAAQTEALIVAKFIDPASRADAAALARGVCCWLDRLPRSGGAG